MLSWTALKRKQKQHLITGYNLSVVEVDGDLGEIIDLFVRINSTGKPLSAAEKRHARFYNSDFLLKASRISDSWQEYFKKSKILSPGQISRMKHVELTCELMVSMHQGDVINKKAVLDKVMSTNDIGDAKARKASSKTIRALSLVRKIFPKLHTTRFNHVSDFYTLTVLLAGDAEGLILTDRRRNMHAQDLLIALSTGVDELRGETEKTRNDQHRDRTLSRIPAHRA
ncbi:MAG: hypothetical protein U1F77_00645 [Kiritimatiellia bacterium]